MIVKFEQEPIMFVNDIDGQLSKEMKEALKMASAGNKIYIEKIKVAAKDNRIYSLFATDYLVE